MEFSQTPCLQGRGWRSRKKWQGAKGGREGEGRCSPQGEEGEEEGRGLTRRGDGGSGRKDGRPWKGWKMSSTSGRGWRGAAPRGWDGEGGVWRAAVAAASRWQAGGRGGGAPRGRGGGAPRGGRGAAAEGLGWGGRWQRVGAVVVRRPAVGRRGRGRARAGWCEEEERAGRRAQQLN